MKKTILLSAIVALIATGCSSSKVNNDLAAQRQSIGQLQQQLAQQEEQLKQLQGCDQIDGVPVKEIIAGLQYQVEQNANVMNKARKDLYDHLNNLSAECKGGAKADATTTFANGSAKVTASAELDAVAAKLKADKNLKAKAIGYTDCVGSADFNLKLSKNRAEAVKAYLVSKGAAASQITTDGLGSKNPASDDKAKNRRVEVIIEK
jgi:outer membrane protein OmpA-like peptidoglycan-associated protein